MSDVRVWARTADDALKFKGLPAKTPITLVTPRPRPQPKPGQRCWEIPGSAFPDPGNSWLSERVVRKGKSRQRSAVWRQRQKMEARNNDRAAHSD